MSEYRKLMGALNGSIKNGDLRETGLTAINILFDNGDIKYVENQACQAGLSLYYEDRTPILSASKTQKLLCPEDEAKRFCDWLVNRSPYSPAFVTKDAEYCVKEGVVTQTDVNANIMVAGQVVHRYLWEWPEVVSFWNYLSSFYGEDFSFLLAHSYKIRGRKVNEANMGGHMAITTSDIYDDYCLAFRNRKISEDFDDGPYKCVKRYSGFSRIWGKCLGGEHANWKAGSKNYVKSNGFGLKASMENPFRKVYKKAEKVEGSSFSEEQFTVVLKEHFFNKYGEWVNA